jgi:SNF2 family DNA or RNA helicase
MTTIRDQLRYLAKNNNIKKYGKLNSTQLIELLEENDIKVPPEIIDHVIKKIRIQKVKKDGVNLKDLKTNKNVDKILKEYLNLHDIKPSGKISKIRSENKVCSRRSLEDKKKYSKLELMKIINEELGIRLSKLKMLDIETLCLISKLKYTETPKIDYTKKELMDLIIYMNGKDIDLYKKLYQMNIEKLKQKIECIRDEFIKLIINFTNDNKKIYNNWEIIDLFDLLKEIYQNKGNINQYKADIIVNYKCIDDSKLKLKPHQEIVVRHLLNPKNKGLLVAHSVGSGKTLTGVTASQCILQNYENIKKVIIITPTSLQKNFKKEMIRYGIKEDDDRYEFYTFEGFSRNSKKIVCRNTFLIIDEAHNLRSNKSVRANKIKKCAQVAAKVMLLTATPIINKKKDLLNALDFIGIKLGEGYNIEENFRCNVSVFTKLNDENYPSSHLEEIPLEMDTKTLEEYNKVLEEDKEMLDKYQADNLVAFYSGVRRASNNIGGRYSTKINWIIDKIMGTPLDEKFLIYSNFLNSGQNLIIKRVEDINKKLSKNQKINYAQITGKLSKTERDNIVKLYNENKIKILFISKAGGEGLDLKGTRYVILMEPTWNMANEEQVMGRAIRYESHILLPKEKRNVTIYRLFLINSNEKKHYNKIITPDSNGIYYIENPYGGKLSVDLFLRNFIRNKQIDIDKSLQMLNEYSIENNDCS